MTELSTPAIKSTNRRCVLLPTSASTLRLERLSLGDLDAPDFVFGEADLFSAAHADAIWTAMDRHRDDLEEVIVHRDAGIRRSPGIAAALSKVLTGDGMDFLAVSCLARDEPTVIQCRIARRAGCSVFG